MPTNLSQNTRKLELNDFLNAVYHCPDRDCLSELLKGLKHADKQNCPPSSLVAIYLIQDLYNVESEDKANINRIITNLESAAEDLYTTSRMIRFLNI